MFFLSLFSLKRVHSESDLDTEPQRKKIFLSEPSVRFFRVRNFDCFSWAMGGQNKSGVSSKHAKQCIQKCSL